MSSLGRGSQHAGNVLPQGGLACQTVRTARGPRKEYSTKRDAEYKRQRYRTDEAYRLDQNQRNRDWRKRRKKDPLWRRYEAVRVMINTKREGIKRTEQLLSKQNNRLLNLCREFVKLKQLINRNGLPGRG